MASGAEAHVYLGLDLGGTKTLAIIARGNGEVLGRAVNPSQANTTAGEVVATMAATATQATADAGINPASVRSAGIGAAGAIVPSTGTVVWSPNVPALSNTPIVSLFREHWDLPTAIGNDANLAALSEQRYGAGAGVSNLLFITVSTGIGGGIIIDDRLYTGATGYAGEVGHITVDAHGPYGNSTTPGAWESLCSGTALARIAGERIRAGEDSSLRELLDGPENLDAQQIFDAMRKGDQLATAVVADGIEYLAIGLTSLINVLNPGLVIIGGGLSHEWSAYIEPAVAIMCRQAVAGVGHETPIVPPALGTDAGALGAVALAQELNP